jgi:hypothetical protein
MQIHFVKDGSFSQTVVYLTRIVEKKPSSRVSELWNIRINKSKSLQQQQSVD